MPITMKQLLFFALLPALLLFGCQTHTHLVKSDTNYIAINDNQATDDSVAELIAPYKEKMGQEMNTVIGTASSMLTLMKPESSLGNWAADLVYQKTAQYVDVPVDFAILNYGGLRIPSIPQGAITKGKVFELMPFDNIMVAVAIQGSELPLLFNRAALGGGWPISQQVSMTIHKEKAQNVLINGKKVDPNKTYYVATNDYLANGGDKCSFLKDNKKVSTNRLFRDVIMEYIQEQTKAGKQIDAKVENRVFILK